MLALILAFQATAGPMPAPAAPTDFDLRRLPQARGDERTIIVRGQRLREQEILRLPEIDDPFLPRAQFSPFGGARMSLDADQQMILGAPSNRAMVTLAFPF